jgi:hypothetical protein
MPPRRAGAFRAAELVRGDRAQVGFERAERHAGVARGCARVDVRQHAPLARETARVGGRLHRADLVVGELHGNEDRVVAHRIRDVGRVVPALPVDGHLRDVDAVPFARIEHARMLDRRRHHVPAPPTSARDRAPHRRVD